MAVTDSISDGFTLADLDAMPDDGRRYELIGGSIIVTPPPSLDHQRASTRLLLALVDAFGPDHEVLPAPLGVSLPTGDEVEPDLIVVEAGRTDQRLRPPFALLVELISSGSERHDTVTKLDAYARAGVVHYWLVDTRPGRHSFRALRLPPSGAYEVVAESTDRIDVREPADLRIPLDDLFSPNRPR